MSTLDEVRRAVRYPLTVAQNRLGAVPRPSWCTFLVCNRCNARCEMCDSWRLPRGRELDVATVEGIFRQVGRLDVVRLSGGEPFLRKDFPALADVILKASRPRALHVTTNGSFPDRVERFARRFSAPERLHVMVSLDGLAAEHDRNRGRAVTFERALRTVERVAALRSRGLDVSVNHTVFSEASMADAPGLRDRLGDLGVEVQTVLAYEDSAMYGQARRGASADDLVVEDGYPLHHNLSEVDAVAFVDEELARLRSVRSPWLRLGKGYYLRGLRRRLVGGRRGAPASRRWQPRCVALRSHLRILPDGSVPICQFNTETVGNLADEGFEAVWRSRGAARARRWVDACAGCWAECEAMPNAIYSGDLLRDAGELLRGPQTRR